MTRISNKLIPNVIIFSIFMCFLGKTASAQIENYDETYYSPTKNEVVVEKYDPIVLYKDTTIRDVEQELILELEGTPMNTETKAKAKTVVVYDESDYYDYAYTARIRRFDNPVIGVGYYDDYYTNMYWYTYNPVRTTTAIGDITIPSLTHIGIHIGILSTMVITIITTIIMAIITTMLGTATTTIIVSTEGLSTMDHELIMVQQLAM